MVLWYVPWFMSIVARPGLCCILHITLDRVTCTVTMRDASQCMVLHCLCTGKRHALILFLEASSHITGTTPAYPRHKHARWTSNMCGPVQLDRRKSCGERVRLC